MNKNNTNKILGNGSYGEVSMRNGQAVKKFSKLSHLIQEYIALIFLNKCKYVVHSNRVDFKNLELHMELYDCNLKQWLDQNFNSESYNKNIMIIIHDIILGLIELHDRGLVHGDLKLNNILIRNNPLKAVLGDCGFVSLAKYAKVERTAPSYRDPIIDHDSTHDLFSLGICLLEMIGKIRINRQTTYRELKNTAKAKIEDKKLYNIIISCFHENKDMRPKCRLLFNNLYKETIPEWIKPVIYSDESSDMSKNGRILLKIPVENKEYIRKIIKNKSTEYQINRAKKGYGALVLYIDKNKIHRRDYDLYIAVTLMILSSLFGKSGFREDEALKFCNSKYSSSSLYQTLERLLSNFDFINTLLTPSN